MLLKTMIVLLLPNFSLELVLAEKVPPFACAASLSPNYEQEEGWDDSTNAFQGDEFQVVVLLQVSTRVDFLLFGIFRYSRRWEVLAFRVLTWHE